MLQNELIRTGEYEFTLENTYVYLPYHNFSNDGTEYWDFELGGVSILFDAGSDNDIIINGIYLGDIDISRLVPKDEIKNIIDNCNDALVDYTKETQESMRHLL